MAKDDKRRIGELEDELQRSDRRIEELRREADEQRDLITRLREHTEDHLNCMERWKETFGMTITEDGSWTWEPFWDEPAPCPARPAPSGTHVSRASLVHHS